MQRVDTSERPLVTRSPLAFDWRVLPAVIGCAIWAELGRRGGSFVCVIVRAKCAVRGVVRPILDPSDGERCQVGPKCFLGVVEPTGYRTWGASCGVWSLASGSGLEAT
jgi:hypothetical protein